MENSASKIIVSFIAGAAAGFAIGILMAPDKGVDTRKKIRDRFTDLEHELENQVEKKFSDIKGYVNQALDKTSSNIKKEVNANM